MTDNPPLWYIDRRHLDLYTELTKHAPLLPAEVLFAVLPCVTRDNGSYVLGLSSRRLLFARDTLSTSRTLDLQSVSYRHLRRVGLEIDHVDAPSPASVITMMIDAGDGMEQSQFRSVILARADFVKTVYQWLLARLDSPEGLQT
jgi:hypothetical protein